MHPLIDAALRATIVLLIAGAATLLLRHATAAARHFTWVLAFGGLIAVPLGTALLPDWPVPLLPPMTGAPPGASVVWGAPAASVRAAPPPPPALTRRADLTPRPVLRAAETGSQSVRGMRHLILPAWGAGAALALFALLVGLGRVWALARAAHPVTDESWTRLARTLAHELGLARPVALLRARGPAMPMTWGVARPVILLPADALAWTEARRHDVLLHELAHVKRHDVLTQLVARLVCAVYWFHPLVWLAATRLRVERERACDDLVLRSGARPSDYAGHLLEIARSLSCAPATALASVAMARRSQLAGRLLDVLDAHRRRGGLPTRAAARAWIGAALVAFPLAVAVPTPRRWLPDPADRPQSPDPTTTVHGPRAPMIRTDDPLNPAASVRPTLARAWTALEPADTLKGCDRSGSPRRHSSVHVNDGTAVHTTIGRCDLVFKAEGRFTFTEDFTDIATVSRGGEVLIELDDGDHLRRLEIAPAAGGTLERVFKVDRETRPFDAEARAWLAETLTLLFRSSGLAAQERAEWILKRSGINGLIEEIALIEGDYGRRQYYQAAVESGQLDARATERLIVRAGQEIGSDYELAELLIAVAQRQPLTEGMQAGFVQAARSLQSDYERRRVLDVALKREGLSPQVARAMLDAASEIGSDYELAELLLGVDRARPIDDMTREPFFSAVNTLQSDYEHRRVLSQVASRPGLAPGVLQATLESAAGIRSDYELAELLIQIAGQEAFSEALSRPFLGAAKTIASDYDAGRVLRTVAARRDLSKAALAALLDAAKNIQSDYELAELLILVARSQRIDDTLRPAFDAAVATIQSRYDNDRVMAALARARGRAELE